jgi:hypothetical protein
VGDKIVPSSSEKQILYSLVVKGYTVPGKFTVSRSTFSALWCCLLVILFSDLHPRTKYV